MIATTLVILFVVAGSVSCKTLPSQSQSLDINIESIDRNPVSLIRKPRHPEHDEGTVERFIQGSFVEGFNKGIDEDFFQESVEAMQGGVEGSIRRYDEVSDEQPQRIYPITRSPNMYFQEQSSKKQNDPNGFQFRFYPALFAKK